MIIFYYNSNQSNHVRILNHLFKSCPVRNKFIYPTRDWAKNTRINQKADIIVFAGIIRGEGNIYRWCVDRGKRFFYIDHAYLNRGYDYSRSDPENEWMRITDSGFSWNQWETRSPDRWNNFFHSSHGNLRPWMSNRDAANVLILPPSLATQYLFPDSVNWTEQIVRTVKRNTDRPVVIREKPIQTLLNANNDVVEVKKYDSGKSIEQELDEAYCVLTYNSAVAVQSIMRGIPTLSNRSGCGLPVSFRIAEIDNPEEPARQDWLNQLVHHQFRTSEMIDGSVWNMLGINDEDRNSR